MSLGYILYKYILTLDRRTGWRSRISNAKSHQQSHEQQSCQSKRLKHLIGNQRMSLVHCHEFKDALWYAKASCTYHNTKAHIALGGDLGANETCDRNACKNNLHTEILK